MSQHWTNFSEYTTDVFPSGWSVIWDGQGEGGSFKVKDEASSTGGKVLELSGGGGGSNRYMIRWDDLLGLSGEESQEVIIRARVNPYYNNNLIQVCTHAGGTASDRYGILSQTYEVSGDQRIRLNEVVNGTFYYGAHYNIPKWSNNQWIYLAVRANNSEIKVKVWREGDSEPDWTDQPSLGISDIPHRGVAIGGVADSVVQFDWIGVGLGGDTAPRESVSTEVNLLVQESRHLLRAESTTVGVQYNLLAQETRHLHGSEPTFLQVYYDLLAQDSYHATLSDNSSLDLFYSLTAQDSRHPVRAEIVSLGNAVILLAPQDSRHAHLVDQPQLSVFYNLEPIQARHNLRSDEVTLQLLYDLLARDSRHIHRTGNTGLTLLYSLDPNGSRHSLRTSDLQLGDILYTLTIDDSSHAHFSDLVTMGFDGIASWGDSHVDKLYAIGSGSDKLYAVKTTNQKLYIITLKAKPLLD